jgi:hypothetical protein
MTKKAYKEIDENDFSDLLKKFVPTELLFRGVITFVLAILAATLIVQRFQITFLDYFDRAGAIVPMVDLVGTFVLLLNVLALYTKDLEFVSDVPATVSAARGYIARCFGCFPSSYRAVDNYCFRWSCAHLCATGRPNALGKAMFLVGLAYAWLRGGAGVAGLAGG